MTATTVALGPAAFDALAAAVRAAKGADPLVPVTVIVPTNTAGVMARRALGRRGGAAAIDVLTVYRLAELLGSPSLLDEGRKPVSTPVVDLAVKQVLATAPGAYRAVAGHPSTVVALRDLYRELRLAGPEALAALAGTPRGVEPARVASVVGDLLAPAWYDEGDLMARAADRARTGLPARLSRVVVHLPERLRRREIDLLRALGEADTVELVVGTTGVADADADVLATAGELTGHPVEPAPPVSAAGPIDVVSTTDADDEVRIAVRAILDAARRGVRFDRMAVLWPVDRPYARLVQHHLGAAGIPWNGRPGTETGERVVPRLLAALLDLDRRGLRRTELMTLLGDVPAVDKSGRRVPTARWEHVGRLAGIVRDEDWDTRLPAYIDDTRPRWPRRAADAESLHTFVRELRGALGERGAKRRWSEWVEWSYEQLERWLGARALAGFGDRLDEDELEAYQLTQRVLDRLKHLDTIGPPVDRAEFRATFIAELDVTPSRRGTVGDGVHIGLLAGSRGVDVDLAVVLGAVEGLLPPAPPVDPLLGDGDRLSAGIAGADERAASAHRQFLAAVTTTPDVLVTMPRGDLRATAVYHPTRWLDGVSTRRSLAARTIDSHAHGIASTEFPVSPSEHRVRELWTRFRAGGDIRDHPLLTGDDVLARAVRLRDARASDTFTEFDGDLSNRPIPPLDGPIAPTRIEAWAACPHAYFVRYVLGVRPVDEPEEIVSVTPLDRGSALHSAVHRLHQAVLDGTVPPPGPGGWTAEHAALLARFGNDVADELEAEGRTGRRAEWAVDRPALLEELAAWIEADRENWQGRQVLLSEAMFGRDGLPPAAIELPGGRRLQFTGQVDRVDRLPDGTLVVTDHKTGRAETYTNLTDDDPTVGGTRFQLPVYAAAARALLGDPDARVHAEYSFFAAGRFRRIGITLDEAAWRRIAADLGRVVEGIEAGVFPAIPDPPGYQHFVRCEYCQPDRLGTAERWGEWVRKRHDPRLTGWFPVEEPA